MYKNIKIFQVVIFILINHKMVIINDPFNQRYSIKFINDYIKINPSRTLKINKLYLSKEFYNLKELKAYNKIF